MSGSALDMAIDELYGTGWSALDTTGCTHHTDGRAYPSPVRIHREFAKAGYELSVRYITLFDCYRAEWSDVNGNPAGAVVGASELEAAIYALAQLRRELKVSVKP